MKFGAAILHSALGAWLLLASAGLGAPNGPFGVPTYDSYRSLSPAEHHPFREKLPRLVDPRFVDKGSFYRSESFVASESGLEEVRAVAGEILSRIERYSRVVSIGRSGTTTLSYIRGYLGSDGPEADDIPFSYSGAGITKAERSSLRRHLERNGLSPTAILARPKPTLIFDFVYTGTGAATLLEEIHDWAVELGLGDGVRSKLHFLGLFPAEMAASHHLYDIYYSTLKELGASSGARPPTPEEIEKAAASWTLPSRYLFERCCAEVFEKRISSRLYTYAGTHGPNAHESFTRPHWGDASALEPNVGFAGRSDDPAFLELYFLIGQGERDRAAGCRFLLTQPVVKPRLPLR